MLFKNPRRLLIGLGILVVLCVGVLLALDARRTYQADLRSLKQQLEANSRLLAEHAELSIAAADVVLAEVEARVRRHGLEALQQEQQAQQYRESLRRTLAHTPQLSALIVADAQGRIRFASTEISSDVVTSVADRDYFQAHRAGARSFIGQPVLARVAVRRVIPVSIRLEGAQGQFQGVVAAALDLAYFEAFYKSLRESLQLRIGVFRSDGTPLDVYPPLAMEPSPSAQTAMAAWLNSPNNRPLIAHSPLDGIKKVLVLRHLGRYPVSVAVAYEYERFLAELYPILLRPLLAFVLFAGCIALFINLILRQMKAMAEAREAQMARTIARNIPNGRVVVFDQDLRCVFAAGSLKGTEQMTGKPLREVHAAEVFAVIEPCCRRALENVQSEVVVPLGERTYRLVMASLRGAEGQPRLGLSLTQDITEQERTEKALQESRDEVRRLLASVEEVREQEQKRLARELHDELGQLITALKLDLGWLKRRPDPVFVLDKLTDMEVLADAMRDCVRRLLTGLRAQLVEQVGLGAACQALLRDFTDSSGVQHQLTLSHEEFSLKDTLIAAVYRILQEALTNIARHALAKHVRVTLAMQENETLLLRVADDGRGFEPARVVKQHSYGLLGIRERVHLLQGQVTINSTPGNGSEIIVELPLYEHSR
jgi:signal transduction histidine kinase